MRKIKKTFSVTAIYASVCYVTDGIAKLCELPLSTTFEKVTGKNAAEIVIEEQTAEEIARNIGTSSFSVIIEKVEPAGEVTYTMDAADFMRYGEEVKDEDDAETDTETEE